MIFQTRSASDPDAVFEHTRARERGGMDLNAFSVLTNSRTSVPKYIIKIIRENRPGVASERLDKGTFESNARRRAVYRKRKTSNVLSFGTIIMAFFSSSTHGS